MVATFPRPEIVTLNETRFPLSHPYAAFQDVFSKQAATRLPPHSHGTVPSTCCLGPSYPRVKYTLCPSRSARLWRITSRRVCVKDSSNHPPHLQPASHLTLLLPFRPLMVDSTSHVDFFSQKSTAQLGCLIQDYLYSAFHDTINVKQLYRKLSFYNRFKRLNIFNL